MARGRVDGHFRATPEHEEMVCDWPPVISADFVFPGDETSESPITALVIHDSNTKTIFAHSCPGKATVSGDHSEYIVTKITDNINSLRHDKVVFKTDGEVAMKALQARVR